MEKDEKYWEELLRIRKELLARIYAVDDLLKQRPQKPRQKEPLLPITVQTSRIVHEESGMTVTQLAKQAGVHKSTMSRLLRYKTHKGV
jgi:DNA-binding MarR family transcriptional regulator